MTQLLAVAVAQTLKRSSPYVDRLSREQCAPICQYGRGSLTMHVVRDLRAVSKSPRSHVSPGDNLFSRIEKVYPYPRTSPAYSWAHRSSVRRAARAWR